MFICITISCKRIDINRLNDFEFLPPSSYQECICLHVHNEQRIYPAPKGHPGKIRALQSQTCDRSIMFDLSNSSSLQGQMMVWSFQFLRVQ